MPDATIYLKDYRAPAFTVDTVALEFDLHDDHALITNQMQLKRQGEGALHLYGDELELISARQMSWATLQDGVFEKLVSEVVLF